MFVISDVCDIIPEFANQSIICPQIFDNHFHFHHNSVSKRSITPAQEHHGRLERDTRVQWAKQQKALSRRKRDFIPIEAFSTGM